MEWMEVNVAVTHEAVEAVADVMTSLGTQGVSIEDPQLINDLRNSGTWELCDIPEQENVEVVTISAYYVNDDRINAKLETLEKELEAIEKRIGKCRFGNTRFRKMAETDWANEWKQYFHVTHVGKSLVIKPSWETYDAQPGEHVIKIDPGMAFGTGTHHTTNMCMARLEEVMPADATVFDVGTGSGILAIAAALLGAKEVKAVDIDSMACRVARENIADNDLSEKIEVREGDLLRGTEGQADMIIANIIADIIIMFVEDVPKRLKEGGIFLTSGIITERAEDVKKAAEAAGLKYLHTTERGGWVVMEFTK